MKKHALILGATGMVGTQLVRQLAEDPDYGRVTALVRRPLPAPHPGVEEVTVDWDKLEEHSHVFSADAVFCCLGTTIKIAGTKEAFRRVDLEYPLTAGRLAKQSGTRAFAIISSLGADEGSPFFYTRVKGEMERRLGELGLPALYILRPSLLTGQRTENRPGEQAAAAISRTMPFLYSGPFRKYKPVEADVVAAAMRGAVKQGEAGIRVYPSAELPGLAAKA
ncbi:MAG: putative nucleoside-diphosphate sugar epimerase [Paenibacillaceae bacterium]|jgi:uncharacterized protein YbjT (DUF2867 family)|nr:putative nucleoside-diphosphate sugar epimerase [Paenibacillaceae bacterium]